MRPDWDTWALGIAKAVSTRGDCRRRQVGCVILDVHHRIIGSGYNGSPPGGPSCLAGECPRGAHYCIPYMHSGARSYRCACTGEWPCSFYVDSYSSYDTGPGACIALHAEQNAIMDAGIRNCRDATIVITEQPCTGCKRMIAGAGIRRVLVEGGMLLEHDDNRAAG